MDTSYRKDSALSTEHEEELLTGSGISPEVVRERGYRTIRSRADLPEVFKSYQRRAPALYVPTYSPDDASTSCQIKARNPRKDKQGKAIKYETPAGSRIIIDVHPRMRERVRNGREPLWVTEGVKSADSLTSRGVPTIALLGVWMAQKDRKLLPCWDHVRLRGRTVYIVFDNDVMIKEGVQLALERQARMLEDRGADVRIVYLPAGDEKVGVDDYLATGGTVKELGMMARRFDPEDAGRFRLERDARLKAAIEFLWERWWEHPWKGLGGHTRRDIVKVAISTATRHGKVTDEGIRFRLSTRTFSLRSASSRQTIMKQLKKLEEEGVWLRREEARPADQAATYVLLVPRATLDQVSRKGAEGEGFPRGANSTAAYYPGGKPLRAPRLRWSAPRFRPRVGVVRGARKVRQTPRAEARPGIKRLGKVRGAVLDVLDKAGGVATIGEICEALHRSRPWELRRRVLPMLEEADIITVEEGVVRLASNWLEALENARELGRETEAERLNRQNYEREREAYRNPERDKHDRAPTEDEMRARRESYPDRRRRAIEAAVARLFAERPEYKAKRVGQVVCMLPWYLPPSFPRGPDGPPKDSELERILGGSAA